MLFGELSCVRESDHWCYGGQPKPHRAAAKSVVDLRCAPHRRRTAVMGTLQHRGVVADERRSCQTAGCRLRRALDAPGRPARTPRWCASRVHCGPRSLILYIKWSVETRAPCAGGDLRACGP